LTAEAEKITSVELCKKANSLGSSKVLDDAAKQIDLYLKGSLSRFSLPLKVSGTPFQLAVWKAIAKVPFGKTISYGEIAASLGKPQAARAVGAAVGANPTPLLVGCHRVLGSNGSLTGYSGGQGIKTKKLLLNHEGIEYD
jgi:methylated-DNA-[protein]-cysteine S-methyltransferase